MSRDRLLKIILSPHISEKSTAVNMLNQYVFEVIKDANKPEIKDAVELLFSVKVKEVRISNVRAKSKRFGQVQGKHQGWKKAYVSLLEGHKIDLMGTQA